MYAFWLEGTSLPCASRAAQLSCMYCTPKPRREREVLEAGSKDQLCSEVHVEHAPKIFADKNPSLYPEWYAYLRHHQPPFLAVWGKNDPILKPEGALAYKRDVPNAEIHLLDSGHYALEEDTPVIAEHISRFLKTAAAA